MERACPRSLLRPLEPRFQRNIPIQLMGRHNKDMESKYAHEHLDTAYPLLHVQRSVLSALAQYIECGELG